MKQPLRLAERPQYKGLPIPFTAMVIDGTPDFRVTDMKKWLHAADNKLCHLCGTPLKKKMWFIGGPNCIAERIFFDLAMHFECALYAFKVCPFLATPMGAFNTKRPVKADQNLMVTVKQFSSVRPETMYLCATNGYIIGNAPEGMGTLLVQANPWLSEPYGIIGREDAEELEAKPEMILWY